jgi:son of sevenless-like protein
MTFHRLSIDTSVDGRASRSVSKTTSNGTMPSHIQLGSNLRAARSRSGSNASTSSSISILSPTSSSTNASVTSLSFPNGDISSISSVPAPVSPSYDESSRLHTEYVLAMHDFGPQQQNVTCLSFRAGQVIHVLNRDPSGWWDGELEGRRGWFPSNYVNVDINSLSDEESYVSFSDQVIVSISTQTTAPTT